VIGLSSLALLESDDISFWVTGEVTEALIKVDFSFDGKAGSGLFKIREGAELEKRASLTAMG
jgi:hypothetical protein